VNVAEAPPVGEVERGEGRDRPSSRVEVRGVCSLGPFVVMVEEKGRQRV
jgi:hypothetical protein